MEIQDETTKAVQKVSLKILSEVSSICAENNLSYFIIGGTLLGAVRHGGFIPWDDDIDIALPRKDYEQLLAIAKIFPFPYRIESSHNSDQFIYPYAKIYDASTTAVEGFKRPFSRGIWIDVFPLDGTFSNILLRKIHFSFIRALKLVLKYKLGSYFLGRSKLERAWQHMCQALTIFIPKSAIFKALDSIAKLKSFDNSTWIGNVFGRWGANESCIKEVFLSSKLLRFEDILVRAPIQSDIWLSNVYGNFMRLPPKEQQKPDHSLAYLNLNSPYDKQ